MKNRNSSMQLTRAADYGVRVMIHLAGKPKGKRLSLPELAAATATPESFLSKVLQALTHDGLLVSQRGQMGGFELSARGHASSVRDVVEAVDGPIHLNVCLTSGKSCSRQAWCPAHPVWARAQEAMLEVLESALIAHLAGTLLESDTVSAYAFAPMGKTPSGIVGESQVCMCGARHPEVDLSTLQSLLAGHPDLDCASNFRGVKTDAQTKIDHLRTYGVGDVECGMQEERSGQGGVQIVPE
ncbi:MAG TPA: Rrf2 family transcriptional regulator [Terracidiphilus sp.]|jgi:Rrf2 family protein